MAKPTKAQLGAMERVSKVSSREGWGAVKGLHWKTVESCLVDGLLGARGGDGMDGLELTDAGRAMLEEAMK